MTRYKTRPGVVLTSICGKNILVAVKSVLDYCPYLSEINETSAFLWNHLVDGAASEELVDAINAEYEVDNLAFVRTAVESFIDQMLDLNYLIKISDD